MKVEEIKVKMILPKAPYKYWSDLTPYPEDLFTGVESYYYPYHSFSIDPITLTPKKELTYKKYYIINYRIPSSSGTSVLNANFEIDYDSFPKEVSSQTTDAPRPPRNSLP